LILLNNLFCSFNICHHKNRATRHLLCWHGSGNTGLMTGTHVSILLFFWRRLLLVLRSGRVLSTDCVVGCKCKLWFCKTSIIPVSRFARSALTNSICHGTYRATIHLLCWHGSETTGLVTGAYCCVVGSNANSDSAILLYLCQGLQFVGGESERWLEEEFININTFLYHNF
jgi:hypothetical protein